MRTRRRPGHWQSTNPDVPTPTPAPDKKSPRADATAEGRNTNKEKMMSSTETTGLPTRCDLELSPREYCNEPVTHYALSAVPPELWEAWDHSPRAALAGFCCKDHAEREPRPTLADAEAVYVDVADGCGGQQYAPWPWRPLLDAYPNPIIASPPRPNLIQMVES